MQEAQGQQHQAALAFAQEQVGALEAELLKVRSGSPGALRNIKALEDKVTSQATQIAALKQQRQETDKGHEAVLRDVEQAHEESRKALEQVMLVRLLIHVKLGSAPTSVQLLRCKSLFASAGVIPCIQYENVFLLCAHRHLSIPSACCYFQHECTET